jgi:hypothetical protein
VWTARLRGVRLVGGLANARPRQTLSVRRVGRLGDWLMGRMFGQAMGCVRLIVRMGSTCSRICPLVCPVRPTDVSLAFIAQDAVQRQMLCVGRASTVAAWAAWFGRLAASLCAAQDTITVARWGAALPARGSCARLGGSCPRATLPRMRCARCAPCLCQPLGSTGRRVVYLAPLRASLGFIAVGISAWRVRNHSVLLVPGCCPARRQPTLCVLGVRLL